MATTKSLYPFVAGDTQPGVDVRNSAMAVTGYFQKQAGQYSFPPSVTAPGTTASAGTVMNDTGSDCLVYASATGGITAASVVTYNGSNATTWTIPGLSGTVTGLVGPILVPGPAGIAVTYSGTASWLWMPV